MPLISNALTVLLASLILAGCQSSQPTENTAQTPAISGCDATRVEHLIGETATPGLLEQARRLSGAEVARVLRPSDVVTLEYNSQRLNLGTDESLVIQRVNCG